jgi:hypothetical protein
LLSGSRDQSSFAKHAVIEMTPCLPSGLARPNKQLGVRVHLFPRLFGVRRAEKKTAVEAQKTRLSTGTAAYVLPIFVSVEPSNRISFCTNRCGGCGTRYV